MISSINDYQLLLKNSRRKLSDIKRENRRTFSSILVMISDDITSLTRPQLFFINDLLNKVNKSDDERKFCRSLPEEVKSMARTIVVTPIDSVSSVEEALFEGRQASTGQIQFDIYPNNEIVVPSSGPCRVLKRSEYDKD